MQNQIVLMNDFQTQWQQIREKALNAVDRVGKSGWLILGEEVKSFEKSLSSYWGLPYSLGCANGLDAIELGLRALALPKGAKVLTTPLSAFATSLAIIRAGGVPVFVDTDATGLIDLELCEKIFSENPDIRYFVPVHLYGHALSYSKLLDLKNKFNLHIVEDCAQAIGAINENKSVGSVGEITATSFYPTKNLGCMGDGGALLTHDKNLYAKALCLRDYGQSQKYVHTELGLNSRLDELQAAILNDAFLPQLESMTNKRKLIAKTYRENIKNLNILLAPISENSDSVWHLFPVLIKENPEDFQLHLKSKNIQSGRHYPILIPHQEALENPILLTELKCAQQFATTEVSLPIHPYMTDVQIQHVIDTCNGWQK
jgi:dTDP-4-amino-4,6-dideoxygalactose transaminase